jgi:hypothetical protein
MRALVEGFDRDLVGSIFGITGSDIERFETDVYGQALDETVRLASAQFNHPPIRPTRKYPEPGLRKR